MSMLSNLELIRRVSLFSTLSPEQAEGLAGAVSKKSFKRGEVLVEQGRKCNALYIILVGRTRVLMTDNNGREVILATLSSGDYVGEMSLIDNEPHSATVVADQEVDVLVLGRDSFLRCLNENMEMAHAVMRVLVQRLRKASAVHDDVCFQAVSIGKQQAAGVVRADFARHGFDFPFAHLLEKPVGFDAQFAVQQVND